MISNSTAAPLMLASSSPYRAELLRRLGLSFTSRSPAIDESLQAAETVPAACSRLAIEKAEAVARQAPTAMILASDQLAELDGEALGKPGNRAAAIAQLRRLSGRAVRFHTALCLLTPARRRNHLDLTTVQVRELDEATIARYVDAEPAYDCAGSFKSEGLGISLFERIDSEDPTALIGLPLIATARLLREAGLPLP